MAEQSKKYHHGGLKEALVTAGLALLEEVGPDRLSLRAIAARVGVSHTAPNNHFNGKPGLLTAMATEGFRRHAAAMQATQSAPTRQARLDAALTGYVRFALENPALFHLMFTDGRLTPDDPALNAAAAESYGVLRDISEGLAWPKPVVLHNPRQTELMLWSFVHGYAQLALSGQVDCDEGDSWELTIDQIMPSFGYSET